MYGTRKAFTAELQMMKKSGSWGGGAPAMDMPALPALPAAVSAPTAVAEVDFSEVLAAVRNLDRKFEKHLNSERTDVEQIQVEIADISGRIRATKAEIAALRHPLAAEDKFAQASSELSSVVKSTEEATEKIMASAEQLDDIIQELRAQVGEGYAADRMGDMAELVVKIFEACNFQDLTGQRITKVVRALTFIEERVDSMMKAWNVKEFEALPLPPSITKHDGDLELHGPEDNEVLPDNFTQDDIDALFA